MRSSKDPLSESNSRTLTDKIVDHFIQNKLKMSVDDANNIGDQIVMNFPYETKVIYIVTECIS